MQKENFRDAEYPRFKVHWSVKLLGWAWVAALVFIIGMVIGGMLGFIDEPEEEGTEAEAVPEAAGEAGTALEAPCLDQRGEFPTGCESVTAVMALRCAGMGSRGLCSLAGLGVEPQGLVPGEATAKAYTATASLYPLSAPCRTRVSFVWTCSG